MHSSGSSSCATRIIQPTSSPIQTQNIHEIRDVGRLVHLITEAIHSENMQILTEFRDHPLFLNALAHQDQNGDTLLHTGISHRNPMIAMGFFDSIQFDPNENSDIYHLFYKSNQASIRVIDTLFASGSPVLIRMIVSLYGDELHFDTKNSAGKSPIHYLIDRFSRESHIPFSDVLSKLYSHVEDSLETDVIFTLVKGAMQTNDYEVLEKFLDNPGYLDVLASKDENQNTLLHLAAANQNPSIAIKLLDQIDFDTELNPELGALLTAQNSNGDTIFHIAAQKRNISLIHFLLSVHAEYMDLHLKNASHESVLDICIRHGAEFIRQLPVEIQKAIIIHTEAQRSLQKQIVVVGAGPIGLYAAIKLAEKAEKEGANVNVILLDPRVGEYTRPGAIDEQTFYIIEHRLQMKLTGSRDRRHIKELERALLDIASTKGIRIQKDKFLNLNLDRSMQVIDTKSKEIKHIQCDMVFDATGPSRAVVKDINTKVDQFFDIAPIHPHFQQQHFIAYVKMNPEDIEILKNAKPSESALEYALAFENLRSLGWNEFRRPYVHARFYDEKGKVQLYVEQPMGLPQDKNEAWLEAVLNLITGGKKVNYTRISQSKKYGAKPNFNQFTIAPQFIPQNMFPGQMDHTRRLPMVIPIGDALIDPNYRLQIGIEGGVERLDHLILYNLPSFDEQKLWDGSLSFSERDNYYLEFSKKQQMDKIIRLDNQDQQEAFQALKEMKEEYEEALGLCERDSESYKIIQKGLNDITSRLSESI